jgi:hypothetical protein
MRTWSLSAVHGTSGRRAATVTTTATAMASDAAEAEKEVQCPWCCERWTILHKATAESPGKHGHGERGLCRSSIWMYRAAATRRADYMRALAAS